MSPEAVQLQATDGHSKDEDFGLGIFIFCVMSACRRHVHVPGQALLLAWKGSMPGYTCWRPTQIDEDLIPSMDELIGKHADLRSIRKVGEGTFGEAFKSGSMVFKIVPLEGDHLVNGEPQKRSEEIIAEASISSALSGLRQKAGPYLW